MKTSAAAKKPQWAKDLETKVKKLQQEVDSKKGLRVRVTALEKRLTTLKGSLDQVLPAIGKLRQDLDSKKGLKIRVAALEKRLMLLNPVNEVWPEIRAHRRRLESLETLLNPVDEVWPEIGAHRRRLESLERLLNPVNEVWDEIRAHRRRLDSFDLQVRIANVPLKFVDGPNWQVFAQRTWVAEVACAEGEFLFGAMDALSAWAVPNGGVASFSVRTNYIRPNSVGFMSQQANPGPLNTWVPVPPSPLAPNTDLVVVGIPVDDNTQRIRALRIYVKDGPNNNDKNLTMLLACQSRTVWDKAPKSKAKAAKKP